MPYIKHEDRDKYKFLIETILKHKIETKGDLEFIVFHLMKQYMSNREYRYSTLHDCVYAVAHASDEFRRRYLDKREDEALASNGDI